MLDASYHAAIEQVDWTELKRSVKLDAREWRVMSVPMATAEDLVERWHYSKSGSSAVVFAHGLIRNGNSQCWGVAWWIPAPKLSVDKFNPGGYRTTLVLHRLVVSPFAPSNAASFLLGRSIRLIKQRGKHDMLLTYADTAQGHEGGIYQATNWNYCGLSDPTVVWTDTSGRQQSRYRQGHVLSSAEMVTLGCQLQGYYAKHVYSMQLELKHQPKQLELWEVNA